MTSSNPESSDVSTSPQPEPVSGTAPTGEASKPKPAPREFGGPQGPEPTRYGDWEKNGRCIDF